MNLENQILELPEGRFKVSVNTFDETDRKRLLSIYNNWRELSINAQKLGGRGINLPEILSEGGFCLEMNSVRVDTSIKGANSSFDAYNPLTKKRIQIKAASVTPDLTSFGPKSIWDELYFVDFSRLDGTFDIYLIPSKYIYSMPVNQNETMYEQQQKGKRPRFSIYDKIIKEKGLSPIKIGNLN
jgi:hypothetical protein